MPEYVQRDFYRYYLLAFSYYSKIYIYFLSNWRASQKFERFWFWSWCPWPRLAVRLARRGSWWTSCLMSSDIFRHLLLPWWFMLWCSSCSETRWSVQNDPATSVLQSWMVFQDSLFSAKCRFGQTLSFLSHQNLCSLFPFASSSLSGLSVHVGAELTSLWIMMLLPV